MPKNIVACLYLLIGLLIFTGCGQSTVQSPELDHAKVANSDTEKEQDNTTSKQTEVTEAMAQKEVLLSTMKVHFIDVGQADATLIEYSDGHEAITMLIDTGNWDSSDVVTYLQSQHIDGIDIVAVTHPHADHIGQLDKVINTFDVTEVWMNGESANSQVFASALAAIENSDTDYYEPEVGDVFDLGPLEVTVLHPTSLSGSTNNNSIALHLQYGDVSFLFTGDAETEAENEILDGGANLKADVLQVGHHGSNTSTTDPFLSAVNPEVAIYSAGAGNQYGHPHLEVFNRLEKSGALVYGTDVHGTVIVETDGKTFNVQTNNQGTIKSPLPTEKSKVEPEKETSPAPSESCVNINTASEKDIQTINHIGPARAIDLIELRPYDSVEDLSRIKGIGQARIADIITQNVACIGG